MFDFISNNFGNIISALALLVSIYSLYVSKKLQCREIELCNFELYISENRNYLYSFDIFNKSSLPSTVTSVSFFCDGVPLTPIECDYEVSPFEIYEIQSSEPLCVPYSFSPYETVSPRYFFDEVYDSLEIRITTKERLKFFKHTFSISANFDKRY